MGSAIDMTGQRFGRLVVLQPIPERIHEEVAWLCLCDCGNKATVTGYYLRTGHTSSCGCVRRELGKIRGTKNKKHGHGRTGTRSPTYVSWCRAKDRCFNLSHQAYKDYGGRGITMCARWKNNFENFLADMGVRPAKTSLDRFPNPDGNYEPGNCRWATPLEQRRNRRKGVQA